MRILLLACLLLLPACTRPAVVTTDGREATALTGQPLRSSPPAADKAPDLRRQLAAAKEAFSSDPSEANAITLGKRFSALGHFNDAINTYTAGLRRHPDSHRLLRHRGHRYITIRKLDAAVADLTRAWQLAQGVPDAPESADGRSTDRTAILYHLGLAHYLNHEFAAAARTFADRAGLPAQNDDNLVSAAHWHYWALRRAGRDADAAAFLTPIRAGMDVRENQSYYILCQLYKGLITAEDVDRAITAKGDFNAGLAYGLSLWKRHQLKDPATADALLHQIAGDDNWPAFAHIAAEADLAHR